MSAISPKVNNSNQMSEKRKRESPEKSEPTTKKNKILNSPTEHPKLKKIDSEDNREVITRSLTYVIHQFKTSIIVVCF